MALISFSNVSFGYNDNDLLDDVSVAFNDNEHVAIIGDNGSGKTTLLRLLAGNLSPDSGVISRNASVYMLNQINASDSKSGGEQQMFALMRAFESNADILLLDEPYSALDYQTRLLVTDDVYKIIKSENKTTIMVTHDIPESISMSDEVIILSNRPSTIKNVYKIEFDIPNRTPLSCRDNTTFTQYFDKVWRSLNSN